MSDNTEQIKEWVRNGRCELCGGKMIIKECVELGKMIFCSICPLMMSFELHNDRIRTLLKEPKV